MLLAIVYCMDDGETDMRNQTYKLRWKVSKERRDKRVGVTQARSRIKYLKSLMEGARFKDE